MRGVASWLQFGLLASFARGIGTQLHNPQHFIHETGSQLYRLSTQRLNIDMKPKEILLEAVNKFLKEKLKEKGFVFSDSQMKFKSANLCAIF